MDVLVSTEMPASPGRVAAIMGDPGRDPEWIGGAKSVDRCRRNRRRSAADAAPQRLSADTQLSRPKYSSLARMRCANRSSGPMTGEVS